MHGEYGVDVESVDLTKEPCLLATAFQKLEKHHGGLLQKVILPGRKPPKHSLLRIHSYTD